MSEITCKTVKRFFYKGKSYASLFQACRQIAKEELRDEVLGPVVQLSRESDGRDDPFWMPGDQEYFYGREKLAWLTAEEAKEETGRLYDDRFKQTMYWAIEPVNHFGRGKWLDARARELAREWKGQNP